MSIDQLRDEILAKKPVIHTRFAEQFVTEPYDVESAYNHHFHTHIPLGDTSAFAKRLVERVTTPRTTKGVVVAPWGYGKTSTLIYTWKTCEEARILTVPPFICASLQDILNATYGWLRFRLGRDYYAELQSVYDQYGRAAFEERLKAYTAQTGVTEADARVVLQSALADGSFTPELSSANLMKFLEYCTALVIQAGFKGMVILVDELQDLVDKSPDLRGTVQKLRDMVWWLAAHGNMSLGMILCMPDTTESIIQEPGLDILDRLKEDHLRINLRNIYNPDFPRQLWERYIELFGAEREATQILDDHLLNSLGQIATREDLGRGPRTVIDVFQCAFRHYDKTGEKYTPLSLIEDFLSSQISFDMQANPIRFAVEDALSLLRNQITTEAHNQVVKLWAAFPEHGCPDNILEYYGVKEAAYELSEMHGVHGPLLTYQSVGYTLRKLASFIPGGSAVERIARDFWLAYKEKDPKWAEAAQAGFIEHVLPRIFDKQSWGKWNLNLMISKGYAGRFVGSFSKDLYPNRILDVQIALEPTRIEPRRVDARSDFQFDFVLSALQGKEAGQDPGSIDYVADNQRWIRFYLNLSNRTLAGANLPRDLTNLKSSIHPNFLTPQLMLAFVDYAGRWEQMRPDNHILENERGQINAIVESMINYSVRVLFSEELKATFGQKLNFAGLQIVREIFMLMCQTAWPEGTYYPLLSISERAFDDYMDALMRLPLREKRGDIQLSERQKGKLAHLFGIDSQATFQVRAKTDYACLMQYRDSGGDQAQVQLLHHPLEAAILQEMNDTGIQYKVGEREVPALEGTRLLALAGGLGYRDEEIGLVLKLLTARELVNRDERAGVVYRVPAGPSPQEVERQLKLLQTQVYSLPGGLVLEREKDALIRRVGSLRDQYSPDMQEENLEELSVEIGRIDEDLIALVARKRQALLEELTKQVQEVQRHLGDLSRSPELEEDVPAGLDFRNHLMGLQEVLRGKARKLNAELNKAYQQLKDLHDQAAAGLDATILPNFYQEYTQALVKLGALIEQTDRIDQERKGLIAWFKLLKESDLVYKSLSTMPDLRTRLTDEIVQEIRRNFTLRGLAALAEDFEQFRSLFDEITRERDIRVAVGHEAFGDVKQRYRQWLAKMGIERSDFPAHYSPVEHEQAYQDMVQQVRSLVTAHLIQLDERLKSFDLDLRRARRKHFNKFTEEERTTLIALERRSSDLQASLHDANKWLSHSDLPQDVDEMNEQANTIAEMGRALDEIDQSIRELILRPVPPQTPEEHKAMTLLANRREADLDELVLDAEDDLDLAALMTGLTGLYQGNQVRIKVQKRG